MSGKVEKVTKKGLADSLKAEFGLTKENAAGIVNFLVSSVVDNLKAKKVVFIDGLGTFTNVHKEERMSVNPRDPQGPKIKVAAKGSPKFKAAKGLKEALK